MTDSLDPRTLTLRGCQLIEASAGTGKTWTIAALYVRLVIGHRCTPRLPGEILVMTFTRAATRELSDRIRRRLVSAAAGFRGEPVAPEDTFLADLIADFPPGPAREQAAWRLAMAADAMDDAAVHTIDAWCQRMLREHAFDSGSLFDETLQAQETAMRAEAARDYWRQQVYPLPDGVLTAVLKLWPDIASLEKDLLALDGKPLPPDAGQGSLAQVAAAALGERAAQVARIKSGWPARVDAMRDWLGSIWEGDSAARRKRVPQQRHAQGWLDELARWAQTPEVEVPKLTKTALERLIGRRLREDLLPLDPEPSVPDCFDQFEALLEQLAALPEPGVPMRLHAADQVRERMRLLKARAGSFGFADMLDRLDHALDDAMRGTKAAQLRARILTQYPVALIDEFQDTSPVQLRIVDRLYGLTSDDPERLLLLIGDPKQAIYQFRGADIYSYLAARRATEGRHHVLGVNHRSTAALIGVVNALFQAAHDRPGEGAFLFGRQGEACALPFERVQARGRPERLVCQQGDLAPLTLVLDDTLRSKRDSMPRLAALCAERIVTLLNDPLAGFAEPDQPLRRLQPSDIAVLVRNSHEAQAVRRELQRRGLASVYLSDRDSVYQTPEAGDLLRLLQAIEAPRDARRARAALASGIMGLSLAELLALASDDQTFDRECERLQQLNQTWRAQGVLAMIRQALHVFGLPARWLGSPDPQEEGERRLTNLLHLAELLQAAAGQLDGEAALVRWLAQQIEQSELGLDGGDERLLRLESDADLVQVVTVHKSKGLEYPLVFLPFPAHVRDPEGSRRGRSRPAVLLLPPATGAEGQPELVLSPNLEQVARAERESLRENLRLLYVALTRARHALWVGLSAIKLGNNRDCVWHRSAIGYLLSGEQPRAPAELATDVRAFAAATAGVAVHDASSDEALPPRTRLQARDPLAPLVTPAPYAAGFERDWSVSSYTALVRDAGRAGATAGDLPARHVRNDEPDGAPAPEGRAPTSSVLPWHRFPRGALAGNFLHDQLEWLAGEGFALDRSIDIRERLLRRCERQGWGHRGEDVLAWLREVCRTPLPPTGVPLSALSSLSPEMEFWFPSDGLDAARVDALCRQHLQPGLPRPALAQRSLKGMLMGFADLVFEHAGRYWVLDYKSNRLGPTDADYTSQTMEAAMREHRYDVQATLYLLALHRLLRVRLGHAYHPDQHLGGAIYLFLRGIAGPAAGCCTITAPQALIAQLDALLQAGQAGQTLASAHGQAVA
jgi:exodeoxyribonuclease V beta subunit